MFNVASILFKPSDRRLGGRCGFSRAVLNNVQDKFHIMKEGLKIVQTRLNIIHIRVEIV